MIAAAMTQTTLSSAPWGERVGVVALVAAVHVGLALVWLMQPESPAVAVSEMSVSVAIQQAAVAQPQAQPEPPPPKQQPRIERAEKPVAKPPVQQAVDTAPQPVAETPPPIQTAPPAVAAAPVVDTAPDYKAAYLNNPRPAYPMAARRMGWEGRVVLNVEVLAEGACGDVNVFQSSGHEVLDNAAMKAVKTWRFAPASRAGRTITQWVRIPIPFILKDNET